MTHLRIDQDLRSGNVTLLVFTPDAMKSQLVGPIERWVRQRTACAPIARQWITHTDDSLKRFYSLVVNISPEDWRMISAVFTAGPCLATLWFGDDAAKALPSAKGVTHPAHCPASTIRGRFWCDNALANLVHVSDDSGEVARELVVLRSLVPGLFGAPLSTRGLDPFRDPGPPTPRHSGILTLCSVVMTLLRDAGASPPLVLPDSGDARETMARAEAWLEQVRTGMPPAIAEAVGAYLTGTANPADFLDALKARAPIDPWEELILRCGVVSRKEWVARR
jgi:nucleoside diphosphate kinase